MHDASMPHFVDELALAVRAGPGRTRHVHLVLENEKNEAALLNRKPGDNRFDAQWADDWHHCVHVLLTGENEGYYEDFASPAEQLARCLREGFAYQGEPSRHAGGTPRGSPSVGLPPSAFVICMQNHDQVGNRALGERLAVRAERDALQAAALLLLMTPQIPMLFMGEEWGEKAPFLFFTDFHDELADAVRTGRRKEFAKFAAFTDPQKREKIPDPNDPETFQLSVPREESADADMLALYQAALHLRARHIAPRSEGAVAVAARALNEGAVTAQWRLGDGALLTVAANLGKLPVDFEHPGKPLVCSSVGHTYNGKTLPGFTTMIWLAEP
jgi:maltooligosyltrehalose trehalohydrolase